MKCDDFDKVKPFDELLEAKTKEFESGKDKVCDKELYTMIGELGDYEHEEPPQDAEEFAEEPPIEEVLVEKPPRFPSGAPVRCLSGHHWKKRPSGGMLMDVQPWTPRDFILPHGILFLPLCSHLILIFFPLQLYYPLLRQPSQRRKGGCSMPTGKIKWFNHKIGAGFIRSDEGENVFFRFNSVLSRDPKSIRQGQYVHFVMAKNIKSLSQTASIVANEDFLS